MTFRLVEKWRRRQRTNAEWHARIDRSMGELKRGEGRVFLDEESFFASLDEGVAVPRPGCPAHDQEDTKP